MSRPTALPIRLRLVGYADSTIATRLRPAGSSAGANRAASPAARSAVGHRPVRGHGDAQFVAVVDHLLEHECGPDDPAVELGDGDAGVTSSGDRPAARASHAGRPGGHHGLEHRDTQRVERRIPALTAPTPGVARPHRAAGGRGRHHDIGVAQQVEHRRWRPVRPVRSE